MASSRGNARSSASRFWRLAGASLVATGLLACGPAFAQTNQNLGASEQARLQRVRVVINKSDTFRVERPFSDVLVGSSDIADVLPLSDRMLYILGKKVGTTNVSLYDRDKRLLGVVDVEVALDTRNVEGKIRSAAPSDIKVTDIDGKLVLSGSAHDAQAVDRAMSVARDLAPRGVVNAVTVTQPQQVMLQVRFLEVQRNAGREFGVRWSAYKKGAGALELGTRGQSGMFYPPTAQGSQTTTVLPNGTTITEQLPFILGAIGGNAGWAGTIFTQLINTNNFQLNAVISALEETGLARRLAEPNLIALSGDTASFLAGGEIPYPVASGSGSSAAPAVAFKEYGVQLNFTPTVLANGVMNIVVAPEVSDLDYANAVFLNGTQVPGLTKRRAKTTVELRDGQSFAIAGLLSAQSARNANQVPWLGSIPILGTLFKSTAFQENETELVLIVTPHLVKPVPPGKQLRSPLDSTLPSNDADFFLANRSDVKKSFREYVSRGGDIKGPYGHIVEGAPGASAAN
ncbi:type II and III secretion system protein family protein [Alsobacter sp. SYSU M60028]|uniref:Type II and III secretion system protein family protein n=1 Tax=Alsobacter ponti TaxID=2962936 RepID=A0ABT1L8N3_9HYPH|nr:type II and III secretion system protein family protein [Alsobacter ponti]MCP8937855.1 type II and III secretion system protein family protein [Alsobacter ponti]